MKTVTESTLSSPLVSVIIPAFNRGYCLANTLRSVLAQTFTDFEIIVVDDGSTDDTAAVARSFGDRVRLVSQKNCGPAAARNAGIRSARGRWIAFQDSDDLWHPKKLERQLAVLKKHGGRWCATTPVDDQGKILCDHLQVDAVEVDPSVFFIPQPGDFVLVAACHPYLQSMLLEKSLVETAGLFAEDLFGPEDTEFIFRLSLCAPMYFVAEPLTVIVLTTSDSLTRNLDPRARERRFDNMVQATEKIYARLADTPSPHKKRVRGNLGYFRLSRAELACVAGDFSRARAEAGKGFACGGCVRNSLRCAAIWCCPSLWKNWYQKKWEGQHA